MFQLPRIVLVPTASGCRSQSGIFSLLTRKKSRGSPLPRARDPTQALSRQSPRAPCRDPPTTNASVQPCNPCAMRPKSRPRPWEASRFEPSGAIPLLPRKISQPVSSRRKKPGELPTESVGIVDETRGKTQLFHFTDTRCLPQVFSWQSPFRTPIQNRCSDVEGPGIASMTLPAKKKETDFRPSPDQRGQNPAKPQLRRRRRRPRAPTMPRRAAEGSGTMTCVCRVTEVPAPPPRSPVKVPNLPISGVRPAGFEE